MKRLRIHSSGLQHLHIAAIGPSTKRAIESLGLRVTVMPERYVAESVVESLKEKVKGKRVLLARAKVARDVIPRELRKMGATVDVVEAYETGTPKSSSKRLQALMRNPKLRPDIITFTSSSTVRNFAELLGVVRAQPRAKTRSRGTPANSPALQRREESMKQSPRGTADPIRESIEGIRFASIGPVTSATLRECDLPVDVEATEYTIPGLLRALAGTP